MDPRDPRYGAYQAGMRFDRSDLPRPSGKAGELVDRVRADRAEREQSRVVPPTTFKSLRRRRRCMNNY